MALHRSFDQFAFAWKRRLLPGFRHNVERTMRQVALVVHSTVVLGTPVDTGRARSNWFVSFGSPVFHNEDSPSDQAADRGTRAAQAAGKAFSQGAIITSWRLGSGDILVANGVPYIGDLDKGSSRQAPAGMTKQAVMAGQRVVRNSQLFPRS